MFDANYFIVFIAKLIAYYAWIEKYGFIIDNLTSY